MSRRFPRNSRLKRRRYKQEPKLLLYIVCEGEKTEPRYLKDFLRDYRNPRVNVSPIGLGGPPKSVIDEAVKIKKVLEYKSRRSKDSFGKSFEVWGIFDVDSHPGVPAAKDKARSNSIKICISNPCFEIWALMHFQDQSRYIDRRELQRNLRTHMPSYNHDQNPEFDYSLMCEKYDDAKGRAQNQLRRLILNGDEGGNPSTDIFELLDSIISNCCDVC